MDYNVLARQMLKCMYNLRHVKPQQKMNDSLRGASFILQYIHQRDESVQPIEISNEMSISSARTAAVLNNLENKGLIRREIDKNDRRQILVTLTTEGKSTATRQQEEIHTQVAGMLAFLGEQDANELIRILGKLSDYRQDQRSQPL